ncbi:hypothetical protein AAG570_012873 [Ranatra chinensis]|uniref:Uncharacterized protein n=1 Tax=Ranatra chinensis TaxID=642074 RepID=A0ABD0Z3C8_9HEMI
MGRGPFFGGSRKMRGFPMNLSPGGLEEGPPPGFPYFATGPDGKFDFGYGAPPGFHHDFFPAHHPHPPTPQSMPFNPPGGGMEGGPMGGMGGGGGGGDFGGLGQEGGGPPFGLGQQPPPQQQDPALIAHRASPEFISSQGKYHVLL